jgi:hypothetical protein
MELERISTRDYDPDTVDQALLQLVLNDYNVTRTCRDLEASGIKVPRKTLSKWRDNYPRRLQFHATQSARELEERIVTKQRAIASAALDVVHDAIEKESARVKAGDVRDMSAAARNMATTSAIATDKLLAMTGRPSAIVQHERKPEQIIARLKELGVVDSTAEEEE